MNTLRMYPNSQCSFRQGIVIYLFFTVVIPIFGIIHLLIEEDDVHIINYGVMFLTQAVAFSVKILPFIINNNEIRDCVNHFDDVIFSVSEEDRHILNNCISVCHRNTKLFFIVISGGLVTWIAKPLLFEKYKTPLDIWLPVVNTAEFEEVSLLYCILYFITSLGTLSILAHLT